MQKLIKNREIVQDNWVLLKELDANSDLDASIEGNVIVPLDYYLSHLDSLKGRQSKVAVWLDSHQDPKALKDHLDKLELVAINFPAFADGRGYSIARELSANLKFEGEIRAIGDVLRDQLFYMRRCGFNAFHMREDQDLEASLAVFDTFSDAYQSSVDQPIPLFRRRA
ncbi:MAG: DUF934 domain-containing protein [Pseudohongiellaceae bacterium]|nr:DUF934 domain-containing protein [Pseudohongiellaceae bacterium]